MDVKRHDTVEGFLEHAGAFLSAREAEHNLILGLSSQLRRVPRLYGADPFLAVLEDGGRVVGAVLRAPPHNLVLSELDDERTIEPIVATVRKEFDTLPGAVGPKERVAKFAAAWAASTGAKGRLELAQRIFRVDRVDPPHGVPGWMRPYEPPDRELARGWADAFVAEALPENVPHPESSDEFVDRREHDPDGGLVFWEDGEPVSMAGFGGLTPNGIRIGPVYTPPELRGRGYASALTAAVTQQLLDGGRRFCFLFTDLANPTSNSIYQRIGYRPVGDFDAWTFS